MSLVAGERRIVAVLYADVVGSTGIGEQLGPERTKLLLDEVIRLMTEQVARYGGTVAQLMGDGLLAVFGAPVAFEDDSERAVRAALGLQAALAAYGVDVREAYGIDLRARVAINTGPVVYSEAVEDGNERYNALGETVNVAARLQELAEPGGVVVGPETARRVEDAFDLVPLGEHDLRGKTAPVASFSVAGEVEATSPSPAPAHALVGRDFELTVLDRALDGLAEGRGSLICLTGEPGIGKTRLLWEARDRFRDAIRFFEGRAVSYAQASPYGPVRDLLREWLGVGATTPEARVRLELKAQLAQLLGSEQAEGAYPFVARLLGLGLDAPALERLRELSRDAIQRQTFEMVGRIARQLSDEQPLCLVLEDLHWADESTLELIESLFPCVEEAPLGLFLVYRSERELGSWRLGELARQRYPHRFRELELQALPADASRALADEAAGAALPDDVARLVVDRAGGNPFFLEEALRDLVERGALRREGGHVELMVSLDELAIPSAVQGALQARLDRLDPDAREVLSIAAVTGRTFGLPLLERLVPRDRLQPSLSELQRLDLVVEERRRPTPEYRFRHGLVQEVAYARLVEPQRRRLHLQVGEALEALHPEHGNELGDLLGRHFAEADVPEKAAEYLLQAGDAAREVHADREAVAHYRRAQDFLRRLGDDNRERDTLFKIALAHHLAFDYEQAEAAYDEALCCRPQPEARTKPTELLRTAADYPGTEFVPGLSYTTETLFFTKHLFRGLLTVDDDLNVLPALADNFRVSGDGLSYLFRLRDDARWSDGVPVTAGDFVYTWKRLCDDRAPTAFMLEDVQEAIAHDDRTLEVRLGEPRNYFLYTLSAMWSYPWPQHKVEELGEDWRKPENLVCNGPFVLEHFDEQGARLVANPFWGGPRGNVRELEIEFTAMPSRDVWRTGRPDVLDTVDAGLLEEPDTFGEIVPELGLRFLGFRADRPPFAHETLRRAFSLAIDRRRVTEELHPLGRPATGGAIPQAMPAHTAGVWQGPDLDGARALLAEAGHPDGRGLPEIELVVPAWRGTFEPIIEAWEALGARVTVRPAEKRHAGELDQGGHCWLGGWDADFPDPDGFFRGLIDGTNWGFYTDEEIADLLARARSLRDRDERIRLYQRIDRLWVQDRVAIVPLVYSRRLIVRRPWVSGVSVNALSKFNLDCVTVGPRG